MISTDTSANVIHASAARHESAAGQPRGRRAALACVAAYLAVSGAMFVTRGQPRMALVHAIVIGIAAWAAGGRSGSRRLIGDLLPLVAAPLLYMELPALIEAVGSGYHDATVQGWEAAVFRGQPARTFAGALPFQWLSELLHAGYLAYYLLIFVPPLWLLARRQRRAFAETVLALTVVCLTSWVLFAAWPVVGPRYLWAAPAGVPDGPFRRIAVSLLAAGSSKGAAFPSSHMAVSAAQAVMAWRWQGRAMRWAVTGVATLVGVGAVYGGFHYGVDILAGAALGGASALLVSRGVREV